MSKLFYFDVEGSLNRLSRYDIANYVELANGRFDVFNSYLLTQLPHLSEAGRYTITTEEFLPQLIAYKIYGDNSLWQLLLYYSQLRIQDLTPGTLVKYFNINDLDNLIIECKSKASLKR